MPLRDLALFSLLGVMAPVILFHPYLGALLWVVFGLMNPHRLAYGPAYDFPFSLVIAILTLVGLLVTRDHRSIKGGAPLVVLVVFAFWVSITTAFALTPEAAVPMWIRVMKIFTMTAVLMIVLHTKRHVNLLLAAILVSIGFYGVKGGIFTVVHGGGALVNGPEDSAITGNNSLGVANVMIIPLFLHFYQQTKNPWYRLGLIGCMLACAAAVLGSYSRGALLALLAMGFVLWLRSSRKTVTMALALVTALVLIPFMPQRWDARMQTIENYESEMSAMGRIWAWQGAWNLANDRALGGGFDYPTPETTAKYSPNGYNIVAHSIYFQTLGEHGFLGFSLFLLFWILVWRMCSSTRREAAGRDDVGWAHSLMSMTQASLVGYAVGGAFLNIAFWDMPYYLYAAVVVTRYLVRSTASEQAKRSFAAIEPAHAARAVT